MQLEIITGNHPTLRKISEPVVKFDAYLKAMVDNMVETMLMNNGAGLAAPQVGENIRLFVMRRNAEGDAIAVVNPEIIRTEGESLDMEGCLSIPGFAGKVNRAEKIVAEFQDIDGSRKGIVVSGFLARVFQHELDHLNGILYPDKAEEMFRLEERK
jgi:peptide deformylase